MSPVQAGGGKGSGQKPGSTAGGRPASGTKPSSGARTANGAGKAAPGRRPAPGPKTASGGRTGGAPGGRGPKQPGGYKPGAKAPQRFSPSTIAFGAVAIVVVIIVAFVVVKVTSSKPSPGTKSQLAPAVTTAPASLIAQVTGVPASVAGAVGLPSTNDVTVPTYKAGQPKLTISGKPAAIFIGAEFCPYCAAERWAIIMAFSKFGTFTGLQETTSSPWDTDPSTPTFTFVNAKYSSPYLTLATSEHESNDTDGLDTRTTLQPLTAMESNLWSKYDGGVDGEGFPFLDIGNKVLVTEPSYNPTVLSGLDQEDVASKLKNANDPVTQGIVGTSNYLTAAICSITGQQPASACSPAVVAKAAHAIGLP
jgi:hypothetical protein